MRKTIPQYAPAFDKSDAKAISQVISSRWISAGPRTKEFERRLASIMGYKHCIATINGTVAISLGLWALGVKAGDKVLMPDFTFAGTANAILMTGAVPIFVDIKEENFGIDWMKALTTKAEAIVLVHLNGRDAIPSIDLPNAEIVADAAQTLGSRVHKSRVATMSFAPNKVITTGQGGAVFTDDSGIAERVRRLTDHGRLDKADHHPSVGFNFKFIDLWAALGLSQLSKLESRLHRREKIFQQYREELKDLPLWVGESRKGESIWNQDILVDNREVLMARLAKMGVETRAFYKPLHTQPAYRTSGRFPITEKISAEGLWLPSSPQLASEEVSYVCDSIRKCLR